MISNSGDSFVPMAPVTPPARKRRVWPFIVAAVAVAGAAAAAVLVLGGGGDDELDTSSAAETIDDISRKVEFADESRFIEVDGGCAIDIDVVEDAAPDRVETGEGREVQSVFGLGDEDDPPVFSCTRPVVDDTGFVGVAWASAPDGDFEDYLARSFEDATVDLDGDPQPLRGGSVFRYCVEPDDADDSAFAFCEADWTDGEVMVGVFSSDIDAEEADEWLRSALVDVIGELNDLDPDDFPLEGS
jgi:hypothetical protein